MNRLFKILIAVVGSILGLIFVLAIGLTVAVRTNWFQNFVRERIISSVEDSTGGKVDVQSFDFDPGRMLATITGFVIHGTEPPGTAPLFQTPRIVLTMRLFSGFRRPAVLEFLDVEKPSANVIAFPDGRTNVPEPKRKSTSNKSGLETVVNLAIQRIEIHQGSLHILDQSMPVDVKGRDLQVTLAYNSASTHYQGRLSLQPLLAETLGKPPLEAKFDVPVEMGADAVQITGATISTRGSVIHVNASVQHMAAPRISAQLVAHVSLNELTRSVDLPIHPRPGLDSLEASAAIATSATSMQITNALVTLGHSRINASGDLRQGADVQASLVLNELASLLELAEQIGRASCRERV